jgi:hypothetical protein
MRQPEIYETDARRERDREMCREILSTCWQKNFGKKPPERRMKVLELT